MNEKKEKRRWGLIFFIVLIMIGTSFSFVFLGFSPASEKIKYNGISFTNNDNVWIAKIDGKEAAFSFLPGEVEKIAVINDSTRKLQDKLEIDVTSDVNSTFKQQIALAQHQMGLTLDTYNIFVRNGFTTNNSFNLPIITCENATVNAPVIYFVYGNETKIRLENNCIIAEASNNVEFIKVKDRLLYGIFGVIK